jgi:hypothetical protein
MKCKVFTGRRLDAVEKQAYGWLAVQKPNLDLQRLESRFDGPATVKLWYSLSRARPVSRPRGHAARGHVHSL